MGKKQNRVCLTFRSTETEEQLYNWIMDKGKIGGVTTAIKIILNEAKEKEEQEQSK